ncbi:putative cytochrome P450 6a14 [Blattella germanica]|nr:putative cytochrome P450 6a14 [Blattella germanica]
MKSQWCYDHISMSNMRAFFLETLQMNWIFVAAIVLYLIYHYSTATFHHWKDKGVPYVKPIPFFGNTIKTICLIQPLEVGLKELYDRLAPHPYGGIYDLRKPILIVRDPEILKQIMIKDFNYFQLIVECSEDLKKHLYDKIEFDGPIIECRSLASKFSTDVIGSCTLGISCNCMTDENSEFTRIGNKLLAPSYEFAIRRLIRFFLPRVADMLQIKDIPQEVTDFFLRLTRETLGYREKHQVIRNDFMELLKQLKNKGTISEEPEVDRKTDNWTSPIPLPEELKTKGKEDIVFDNGLLAAQAFAFFVAGFETTGGALTFCLHELAINPHIQVKLREEIDAMLQETNGNIVYENVNTLPYLDKVIWETLRKYPTAGHTLRRVTKRYVIPQTNVRLDVGDLVIISMFGLHHDPKYYPDPEKFDPERFSKEEVAKRHPCAYLPFGTGPRACIGMRFAVLEMKVALTALLPRFNFETCPKTQHPLQFDSRTLFIAVKNGAWLKVTKLNKYPEDSL